MDKKKELEIFNELKIITKFLGGISKAENILYYLEDLELSVFYRWARGILHEVKNPNKVSILSLIREYKNCYCGSFLSMEELASYHLSKVLGYELFKTMEEYLKIEEKAEDIASKYTLIYTSDDIFIAFKRYDIDCYPYISYEGIPDKNQ